jgi:penicillin-binding protein 2
MIQKVFASGLVAEQLPGGTDPVPGRDLYLTLDARLQVAAEVALGAQSGAIVMVKPKTGELLTLACAPRYDLNHMAPGRTLAQYRGVIHHPGRPLLNRASGGASRGFPPGSVFKIVTTMAGLETGSINRNSRFSCSGGIPVAGRLKKCWRYPGGHGSLSLIEGLRSSCDVYYYNVGERVGIDDLVEYARQCGFGKKSGLEGLGESEGALPDPMWRTGRVHVLNSAIGQGDVLATPMQIAMLTAAIANGGKLLRPLIAHHNTPAGKTVNTEVQPHVRRSLPASPETVSILREGLEAVVNAPSGSTGRNAKIDGLRVSGKTGTAESPGKKDHAWFTCYAPGGDQEAKIVCTVFLEHCGEGGGAAAAPIAREMLEKYYDLYEGGLPEPDDTRLAQSRATASTSTSSASRRTRRTSPTRQLWQRSTAREYRQQYAPSSYPSYRYGSRRWQRR